MRKFISVLLALMLVLSTTVVAFNAYNVVDTDAPSYDDAVADAEYDGPMAKIYFQMPNGKNGPIAADDVYVEHKESVDPETGEIIPAYNELVLPAGSRTPSWQNKFNLAEDGNYYPGMYWWDAPSGIKMSWPGFRMNLEDADNCIYSAEIPGDGNTVSFILNNGVDGGTDSTQEVYYYAAQTLDMSVEGAYAYDWDGLWEDTYNEFDMDGCIFITDPSQADINTFSGKQTIGGTWYFYYGNGCYGNYRTDSDEFTSAEENCVNPDHFNEAGEHVGYHEDEPTPTEPAPTEPAPTEPAPTEPAPTEPAPTEPAPTEPAPTEPVVADTFIVAGNAKDIFGTSWNGNDANNAMEEAGGMFAKSYTVTDAMKDVQLKVVKNGTTWIGDETGNNVTFDLTGAGTFTVCCDGEKAWVEGDIVSFNEQLDIESVTLVGNGTPDGSGWLNNIAWDPAAEANHMTNTWDSYYEAEYTLGEYDPSDLEFKFAINDAWTNNFGLADDGVIENDVVSEAVYNGSTNLKITGLTPGTTIRIRIDLSNFDFKTKTGADMLVTWTAPAEPTEPAPTEPAPTEPAPTEPAPTVAPTEPAPSLKPNTYYLYGTIASMNQNWSLDPALEMTEVEDGLYKIEGIALRKAELGVDQFGNPIKNSDPAGPEIIGDSFKVVKSSKRGTSVTSYYPDGVDNNRTVPEDGIYTIYFRPNGDGNPEEGWIKVYTMSDPEGDPAAHGAKVGGYMYKFEKTADYVPPTEPAPTEPAPTEPAPTEPAPTEPAPTEPVTGDTFIVAGNATEIFGTSWNGNDANNSMEYANDVWYKEYTVSGAMTDVQLKAVKNGETWIGDETGNNVTFNLTGAGTFTVYCDGEKTWVEGDIVEIIGGLDVQSVTAVGNGSSDGDNWLNNEFWNEKAASNHMSKVSDGVYEIEFTLGEFDPSDVEFKFAVNDAWTHNFGLGDNGVIANGVETDAIYNGSTNLKITGLTAGTTIKMQLDLTGFDFESKTGAKMTVTWGSDTPASILGDADGDGEVTAADAALIQRYDAQMPVGDNFNATLADVNGDGEVDILDVTLIQRYLAGMTVKYPIGNPAN